jgi:outer membrane protein
MNASVDLFTGFRRGADSKAARATRDAADANLVDARYTVTLTTALQFYAALAAQQLVRVREASVTRAQEQLKVSVAKLHAGSATRSDSLRSLVTLGSAQLELVSAQADVATQQAELGRLTGIGHRVTAADDSSFYQVIPQLDTSAIMTEAEDRSPKVQNTAATAVAARASVKAARSGYWPMLALTGSTNWNGTDSRDYQLFASRALTLGLSWTLFNRFQREQTIVNRLSTLDQAEATASDTKREVQASLTSQFALLDAARLRLVITKTSVEAAEEDLRVVSERYRLGAATIVDILTSQEALTQAQVDAVNARFDYLRAKIQIEALIGRQL